MLKRSVSALILGGLLLQPLPAHAYWGHGWRGGYGHHFGPGYFALTAAGLDYLYYEGLFYRYTPAGYLMVEPPVGAVIPALPPGYTSVMIQRTPYYYYNGIYYAATPAGYTVTEPPPSVPAPMPTIPAAVSPAPSPATAQAVSPAVGAPSTDSFDIYVPNGDGTFTLVTLKKTEKGFIGPQGELYPEHPTVEKLKVLYGKTTIKK